MNEKTVNIITHSCVAVIAVVLTFLVLRFLPEKDYNKLAEMEKLIVERYPEEVDQTELEDAAAHAMIAALGDRWSYYIPADEYAAFYDNKQNEYVGIGITVEADEDGLKIVEVTAGGPSQDAGLLAEDVILEVDGTPIRGKNVNEAGALIRGEENSRVMLKIRRGESELDVAVVRRRILVPVATGVLLDGEIGLVTIKNFNTNCFSQSKQVIEQLLSQGAQKLIFDVRNNGGGYAEEMVKLLDYLLPEGQLFKMVDYQGKEDVSMSDANCVEVPMAVLVNGGSYSAAECFAAALREYDAAAVVGEKTSGKGYYQIVYKLKDGSALGLSVGKYYTPNNVNLEGVGLLPDFEVAVDEKTASAIYAGTLDPAEDPQIVKAVEILNAE